MHRLCPEGLRQGVDGTEPSVSRGATNSYAGAVRGHEVGATAGGQPPLQGIPARLPPKARAALQCFRELWPAHPLPLRAHFCTGTLIQTWDAGQFWVSTPRKHLTFQFSTWQVEFERLQRPTVAALEGYCRQQTDRMLRYDFAAMANAIDRASALAAMSYKWVVDKADPQQLQVYYIGDLTVPA